MSPNCLCCRDHWLVVDAKSKKGLGLFTSFCHINEVDIGLFMKI